MPLCPAGAPGGKRPQVLMERYPTLGLETRKPRHDFQGGLREREGEFSRPVNRVVTSGRRTVGVKKFALVSSMVPLEVRNSEDVHVPTAWWTGMMMYSCQAMMAASS